MFLKNMVWVHIRFLTVKLFFQAEDGIRDKLVTGVQTCALPISKTKIPQVVSKTLHKEEF